jgi:hypothetical protein
MADRDTMTATTVGLTLLAVSEVPNFLAGMLPSLMTIRRFGAEDVDREALRQGEIAGAALALTVGVGAALVAQSWLPAIGTVAVLAVMLAMYEHAIRNPHDDAVPIDQQDTYPPHRVDRSAPYGWHS